MFFWLLIKIWNTEIILSWFCDYYTILPVLFGKFLNKKVVIVIGGFDAAKVDEINYGAHQNKFRSKVIQICVNLADELLPVSQNTEKELFNNVKIKSKDKSTVIYNGVETERLILDRKIPNDNSIITVGGITKTNLKRKGIELFIKAAQNLPDHIFYLVGRYDQEAIDLVKDIIPDNLIITGEVRDSKLAKLLYSAKVYVQASIHEGFGISLADAMYCKCIPVVSYKTAIPEVVGKTGYYLKKLSVEELVDKVKLGLNANPKLGQEARRRIINNYTLEIRKNRLLNKLENIMEE